MPLLIDLQSAPKVKGELNLAGRGVIKNLVLAALRSMQSKIQELPRTISVLVLAGAKGAKGAANQGRANVPESLNE